MNWAEKAAVPLENEYVLLRPVRPGDREALRAIAMDPRIWRYFVARVETEADFDAFFDLGMADQEAERRVVYYIADKRTGAAVGSMSFGNITEQDGRIEIGWSWLGIDSQGKGINRWAKFLMMQEAFEHLGAERVEFKTDLLNVQARHALTNIGAREEGTLRSFNPMPDGRRRDAVYYSVLKAEWPQVKAQLLSAPKVSLAEVGGDPFEVGLQHGAARAQALRAFIDDDAIAVATPALSEEIAGLASGAGISPEEVLGGELQVVATEQSAHFGLLSQPAICVGDTGDVRRERTVAAVVMLPERRELHLRPGDPSRSGTATFRIQP